MEGFGNGYGFMVYADLYGVCRFVWFEPYLMVLEIVGFEMVYAVGVYVDSIWF